MRETAALVSGPVIEKMADVSQPNNFSEADVHLSRLLVTGVEVPFYRTLIQNLKDLIDPPKLPPLEITSKPVAVKDIWGLYGRQKRSFMMSTGFQLAVVTVLFTVFSIKPVQTAMKQAVTIFAPDLAPPDLPPQKQTMQGGGGGGDRSPLPAAKGRLPKPALRQFTPPVEVANNLNPKLTMEPTIIAPPDLTLPNVNMPNYGDPLAKSARFRTVPVRAAASARVRAAALAPATAAALVLVMAAAPAAAYSAWAAASRPRCCSLRKSPSTPRKPARQSIRERSCCTCRLTRPATPST